MARLTVSCEGVDLLTHELSGIVEPLRRRFARFKLGAQLLDLRCLVFYSCDETCHRRFQLLSLFVFYWLKDLNSTNGTLINGVLATGAELNDGDKIRFGFVGAVFTGRCCKRRSNRGLRFWTTLSV